MSNLQTPKSVQRLRTALAAVGARLVLVLAVLAGLPALAAEVAIGIVHVNDVYQIGPIDPKEGRGGLARLGGLVEDLKRRNPNTLLVFGGDTLSPSVESTLFRGRQMMAAWNALGVEVAVLGNHEFDFGPKVLDARLAESKFPWLAANVRDAAGGTRLAYTTDGLIKEIGGIRIGFVGVLTPDTARISMAGPGVAFSDPVAEAGDTAARLRGEGATVLVALTHLSLREDRALAATGIFDVILGGHDHFVINSLVGRTPIFKAGSDVRDALHLTIRADSETGALRGLDWLLLPVDRRWPEAAAVAAIEREFKAELEQRLGEPIGESTVALEARGRIMRSGESNFANFVVDALRREAGADLALMNGGAFRSDRVYEPGPLTRLDVKRLLPFENAVPVVRIDGATLRKLIEHGLARLVRERESGANPHISGFTVRYDAQAEDGKRIVDLRVGGEALDESRQYTLATSSYLARGGDGYTMLKGLPVVRSVEDSRVETDIVIEALQNAKRISPAVEGRVSRR